MCGTDTAGRGALEPLPEAGARTKLFDRELIPVPRIAFSSRDETKLLTESVKEWFYGYVCICTCSFRKKKQK